MNMKYAIIQAQGKQYTVKEGEELLLEGLHDDKKLEISEVLLVSDEGKVKVGNPYLRGAKVQASLVGTEKGEKINVRKYKSKSRYRKAIGHRAKLTRVKVEKIVL